MIKYDIWFKNFCIGKLYINEAGQYKYVVYQDAVDKVEKAYTILADAKTDRDWGEPIAFFDSRIENCKRFGKEDEVGYPNSDYYFIKDNH